VTWPAGDHVALGIAFLASTQTAEYERFGTITAGPTLYPFQRLGLFARVGAGIAGRQHPVGCRATTSSCSPPDATDFSILVAMRIGWVPLLQTRLRPSISLGYARTLGAVGTDALAFDVFNVGLGFAWSIGAR
jgi:hypothetical protein